MTSPVIVELSFNEGRPGAKGDPGPAGEVPAARKISADDGLLGGGDLSADRSLGVDFDANRFGRVKVVDAPGGYTLADGDQGAVIKCTSGSAQTVTVPASIFAEGDVVEVMQYGAGEVTVAAGAGITLREAGKGLKVAAQYHSVMILFLSASEAVVTGGVE